MTKAREHKFSRVINPVRPRHDDGEEIPVAAMAYGGAELESQLRSLLKALKAVRQGDFSVRLPVQADGVLAELALAFNEVVGMNESIANEMIRVSRNVGEEGLLNERATLPTSGSWKASIDSINSLINSLAQPTIEVGRVIAAVAEGDLTKKMTLEIEGRPLKGEFQRIGTQVNTMVTQLSSFSAEVTRVAREVGTEGKLGAHRAVTSNPERDSIIKTHLAGNDIQPLAA